MESNPRSDARARALTAVALTVLVLACFSPVLRNGFVSYDDPAYVLENPHVNTGLNAANFAWAFTSTHASNWHPLTWISHQLDCTLFGLSPAGHHFTSLLLHALNTALLFFWLSGATGRRWRSAFVAAIFGLHPLHVESVAWIAERKDVLSTCFLLLTLLAYSAYAARPTATRYLAVAALFVCGLLAKPMLVTLPLLLLLLDWWPLRRVPSWRLLWEKVPLLALAAASSAVTILAQRAGNSLPDSAQLPLSPRLANAVVSYIRYLGKTVWPSPLAAFYPFPLRGMAPWKVAAAALALAAITWMSLALRKHRPWLACGWSWYLLTLVPVIGIVQVGMQSMADRYMYVPMIGLLIAAAWELASLPRAARVLPAAAICAAGVCAVLTWRQIPVWHDGFTLFAHAAAVVPDNFVAHDNLGVEYDRRGQFEEALAQYREALRIRPGDRNAATNYSRALCDQGERLSGRRQLPEAIAAFRSALAIDPTLVRARMGLAVALSWSGDAGAAAEAFTEVVRREPANLEARYDLGLVLSALGRNAEALQSFDAALRLNPDFAPAGAARTEVEAQMAKGNKKRN